MIWFAAFHPKEDRHWWAKRFCHVSLAGFSNDTWTQMDYTRRGVDVRTFYAYDEVQDYLSFLTAHHTILRVGRALGPGVGYFRPMTCVGFVKHTLGVRSRALLPDGLFTSLIREHNAVMMNDAQSAPRDRRAETGAVAL